MKMTIPDDVLERIVQHRPAFAAELQRNIEKARQTGYQVYEQRIAEIALCGGRVSWLTDWEMWCLDCCRSGRGYGETRDPETEEQKKLRCIAFTRLKPVTTRERDAEFARVYELARREGIDITPELRAFIENNVKHEFVERCVSYDVKLMGTMD